MREAGGAPRTSGIARGPANGALISAIEVVAHLDSVTLVAVGWKRASFASLAPE
jgi:hypothetical protein